MKNVIIKQTILGQGMPKICAPLVETDYESLIHRAASFTGQPVDIAEWRADWFDSILEPDTLDQVLPGLESALKDIPLLFTFRTKGRAAICLLPCPRTAPWQNGPSAPAMYIWWIWSFSRGTI